MKLWVQAEDGPEGDSAQYQGIKKQKVFLKEEGSIFSLVGCWEPPVDLSVGLLSIRTILRKEVDTAIS